MKLKSLLIAFALIVGFPHPLHADLPRYFFQNHYVPCAVVPFITVYHGPLLYPPVVYSVPIFSNENFSNLSPLVTTHSPVQKVTAPYIVSEPLIVHEESPFRWRK